MAIIKIINSHEASAKRVDHEKRLHLRVDEPVHESRCAMRAPSICSWQSSESSEASSRSGQVRLQPCLKEGAPERGAHRRSELASIMLIAWGFHRAALAKGEARLFSESLKAAWSWKRRMQAYLAKHPLVPGRIGSARDRLGGSRGWGRGGARYLTTVVGR